MTAPRDSSGSRHRNNASRRLSSMIPESVSGLYDTAKRAVVEQVEESTEAVRRVKRTVEGVKRAISSKYGD